MFSALCKARGVRFTGVCPPSRAESRCACAGVPDALRAEASLAGRRTVSVRQEKALHVSISRSCWLHWWQYHSITRLVKPHCVLFRRSDFCHPGTPLSTKRHKRGKMCSDLLKEGPSPAVGDGHGRALAGAGSQELQSRSTARRCLEQWEPLLALLVRKTSVLLLGDLSLCPMPPSTVPAVNRQCIS